MLPTTPPPTTAAVEQTTPIHLHSSTTSRISSGNYVACEDVFATLSAEMSPYFLGPMPCSDFLSTFLPVTPLSDLSDSSAPKFSEEFFSSLFKEGVNIYTQFVEIIKPIIPNLLIYNTSHSPDKTPATKFPFSVTPDFSIFPKKEEKQDVINSSTVEFTKKEEKQNVTNASKVEFTVEYKSLYEEDPFVRKLPSSGASDQTAKGDNPFMNPSSAGRKTAGQITAYVTADVYSKLYKAKQRAFKFESD
ncbi:hypothetical protein JOM56_004673 [Amanita muscaria]